MNIINKILKVFNSLYLYFSANILAKFIIGFSGILLARFLSKEDFGILKTITTFIGLIGVFVNFGLNDLLLFRMSQNSKSLIKIKILNAFLFNYAIFFPICLILFFILYPNSAIGTILIILFYIKFFFDWIIDINNRLLQAKNTFSVISILILTNSSLIFTIVLLLYMFRGDLIFYGSLVLLASIISATISSTLSKEWNYQVLKKIYKSFTGLNKTIFKNAFPYFASGLMAYVYMQSDILMLSIMKEPKEVSRYTVVTTIIFAAYLIPSVLYNYFLPKITFQIKKHLEIKTIYKHFLIYLLLSVIPLGVLLFLFSQKILAFLYAKKYIDSFLILKILSLVFVFHSFCFLFGALLTASGNQTLKSKIQFLAALMNILLNLIFIPLYGAEGAALTTAITEIVIFSLYITFSIKIWRYIHCVKDSPGVN